MLRDLFFHILKVNYNQPLEVAKTYTDALREKYALVKSEWSSSHAPSLDISPSNFAFLALERGLHRGEESHPAP